MFLWLWRRLAVVAPIRPLALEPPYAAGTTLKSKKKKEEEVPTVVQWVKNLTAAARVASEVHLQSLAWHSELKDQQGLLHCGVGPSFGLDSIPGPGMSICHRCAHKNNNFFKKPMQTRR